MGEVLTEVANGSLPLERFADLIGARRAAALGTAAARGLELLGSRTFWNVNSTAAGGGVDEMLQTLVHYARGAGVDARWLVLHGTRDFFVVTKRLHNCLHGFPGDGCGFGDADRQAYEAALAPVAAALCERVRPGEVVLLHDPQTAGLVPALVRHGAHVAWRCHIGTDTPNECSEMGWRFLRPWVSQAHAHVFTRAAYVPTWLHGAWIIPPSIDPFAVKNLPMSRPRVRAIVGALGVAGPEPPEGAARYERGDGTTAHIRREPLVVRGGPPPPLGAPLVVQVSRWDRLKDMSGVMTGFARATRRMDHVHLALVGPSVEEVSDDPEGAAVYAECLEQWRALPPPARARVALVTLPMDDVQENAAMVNAIQRHASVIVQKSIQEGFGLTVTEAMWKRRPILASAVGGIVDQIEPDVHGLLVQDPHDRDEFAAHLCALLEHRRTAQRLARNAYRRCLTQFLPPRHLTQYVELLEWLVG